ncbi:signal transduction histidine kinase [Lachnospiraceae bacterium JC7]|nr:signal transduction histidine kinase [Lachnospiraceae bacterium JC7]
MIQKTFIIHDESETFELLASVTLYSWYQKAKTTLAFLSCSNISHIQMQQVVRVLRSAYPDIKVIAGTQAVNDGMEGRCTVRISFLYFDESYVETKVFDYNKFSKDEIIENAKDFLRTQNDLKGVCLLTIGNNLELGRFIEEVSDEFPDVPFFGSVTGDPVGSKLPEDQSGSVMADCMTDRGIAMAALSGENLHIMVNQQTPWKAVGRELTAGVESKEKNDAAEVCLTQLDGKPAVDIYRHYLGVEFNEFFLQNVSEFPLIQKRYGSNDVVHIPMYVTREGELFYYSEIRDGDKLRLGYGNPEDFLSSADSGSQIIDLFGAQSVLLFVCFTHPMILKKEVAEEIKYFLRNCVSLNFFYSLGEIYRFDHTGGVQSGSLTAVAMREGDKNEEVENTLFKMRSNSEKKDIIPLNERLINFLEVTTSEYDEMAHIAEQANKAKSDFLSNMSHEIRTPINAVLGMDEIILRDTQEPKTRKYAENIQNAGNILLSLVNDILDFSKIEAGKMNIIPVEYDVRSTLNDLLNMLKKRASDKGLEFRVQVDPRIPCIMRGDVIRLKQVVLNIVNNAIKYTNYGSIMLKAIMKDEDMEKGVSGIRFNVIDSGIGIKRDDLPRLFNAFDRIEEDRNRAIEGTGLGMNITQRLLQAMGSHLEVDSIYGVGSNFGFTLMQEVLDWNPVGNFAFFLNINNTQSEVYRPGFEAPDARILIVDDAPMNLQVVEGLLDGTKMQMDTAISGHDCLSWVQENEYDLILLDYRMPQMDGIETLHALRRLGGWREKVPVICLTANALTGAREQYLNAGFDDYVTKPIKPKLLEKTILQYLPESLVTRKSQQAEAEVRGIRAPESIEVDNKGHVSEPPVPLELYLNEELDIYHAFESCGGPQRFFVNLKEFSKYLLKAEEEIKALYAENDIKGFTIKVHALKSSSGLVGFMRLSRLCGILEKDGDSGDLEDIHEKFPELIGMIAKVYSGIKDVDFSRINKNPNAEQKAGGLDKAYEVIRQAVEDYDYDKLTGVLESLEGFALPEPHKQRIERLIQAADELDWMMLQEIMDEGK